MVPGPFPGGPKEDWDADQESKAPHPELISKAADTFFEFYGYTRQPRISGFDADSISNRKLFQDFAFHATSALKAAEEVDPSLSRVCWTLLSKRGMDVETARTTANALRDYWTNGELQIGGTTIQRVKPDEMSNDY
jgi:hypothetical protein